MDYNNNMGKIVTLNGVESENILNDIFDNDITVYEDIQGSKFGLIGMVKSLLLSLRV